jgi:hypothetical protein
MSHIKLKDLLKEYTQSGRVPGMFGDKDIQKWKDAEGSEKEDLYDRLRQLNKIKKELENLLENKN